MKPIAELEFELVKLFDEAGNDRRSPLHMTPDHVCGSWDEVEPRHIMNARHIAMMYMIALYHDNNS